MNRPKPSSAYQLDYVRHLIARHRKWMEREPERLQPALELCYLFFVLGAHAKEGWEKGTEEVHALRMRFPQNNSVKALEAGFLALKAKYASNPLDKWNSVNQCMERLDYILKKQPDLLEARLVRFAVTYNLPALFGRQAQRKEDLRWLMDAMPLSPSQVSPSIYDMVLAFLENTSDIMTSSQKTALSNTSTWRCYRSNNSTAGSLIDDTVNIVL